MLLNQCSFRDRIYGLMKDPWGNTKCGLSITGKINRKELGLTWNAKHRNRGGVLVGEDIKLVLKFTCNNN
jgi:polyisoprenoid-binding protein YceI